MEKFRIEARSLLNKMSFQPILDIASKSAIAKYRWKGRGLAPVGFIKGMAFVYARVYCKLKVGNAAAIEMSKAKTSNDFKDALSWYEEEFLKVGMKNETPGIEVLRALFMLLIGLGMRESSGRYCAGRDKSASNTSAETAEAGLLQTSYNARRANSILPALFDEYLENPSGFKDIFKEGVRCTAWDRENYGSGKGREFQRLEKECPAFAVEFAAVGLRNIRKHWGPINRKTAELKPECIVMFKEIEKVVDSESLCMIIK